MLQERELKVITCPDSGIKSAVNRFLINKISLTHTDFFWQSPIAAGSGENLSEGGMSGQVVKSDRCAILPWGFRLSFGVKQISRFLVIQHKGIMQLFDIVNR